MTTAQEVPVVTTAPEVQAAINAGTRDGIRNRKGELVVILTETEGGIIIGWDVCHSCKRHVRGCRCEDGPTTPPHVQKWRYAETTPDLRNQMGDLKPMNRAAEETVERHARSEAKLVAPTTPQQMAEKIAAGLKAALLPDAP